MKKTFFRKLLSLISAWSLLVNQLLPVVSILTVPAFAEEVVKPLSFDNTSNSFTFPDNDGEEINYLLAYRTAAGQTEVALGREQPIYAGTCSEGGSCVDHEVSHGLLKTQGKQTRFVINKGKAEVISETADPSLELSEADNQWLESNPSSPQTTIPLWLTNADGSYTTADPVSLNTEYSAPFNDKLILKFTKLPATPSQVTLREIAASFDLGDNQQVGSAYEITSTMADGEFTYDLTLPIPTGTSKDNLRVGYAENLDELQNAQIVDQNQEISGDSLKVTDLDHLTVFVLVNDIDTDNPDSLGDSDDVANGVFSAIDDTYAGQGAPTTTRGTSADLNVRSQDSSRNQRTYVKFDTSPLLSGSTVSKATLRLFMNNAPSASRTYNLYSVTSSWNEGTLTWNLQPSKSGSTTASITTGTTANVWVEWDVTADVQAFINGSLINYGWTIWDSSEDSSTSRQAQFNSSEQGTELRRPQLVVDFAVAADQPTDYKSPAQAATTGGDGNGFETSPTNAFTDGGGEATNSNGAADRHIFSGYGFSIPEGATNKGIEVRVDWRLDDDNGTNSLSVELSWDGGTSWTSAKSDATETDKEHVASLGSGTGAGDTWGRTWSASEFSDSNFRVRVTSNSDNANRDFYLDWIPVRVYYTPDTTTPTDPADVASTSHGVNTPSTVSTIDMAWTAAGSAPGATDTNSGVDGYSYEFTSGATDVPDAVKDAEETATGTSATLGDGSWYFHLRTVDNAGNWTSTVHEGPFIIDATGPILSEVTPVSTPTNNSSPDYTFNSDEDGDISYGGSCSGGTSSAAAGDNTITFDFLSDGIYSDCTITVTDSAGNQSDPLSVSTFTVDTQAPTVQSAETQDLVDSDGNPGSDGNIDAIKLTFSEDIDDSMLDEGNPDGWDVADPAGDEKIETGDTANDNILLLSFGQGPDPDTANTPTVTYTPSGGPSTHDLAGNELASDTWSTTDKASPVLLSAETRDTDADGYIDKILATFSEDLNDETVTSDKFDVSLGYSIININLSGSVVELIIDEKLSNDTGAKPDVSVFEGDEGEIEDLNGVAALETEVQAADGAAPVSTIDSPLTDSIHNSPINISGSSSDGQGDTVSYTRLYYQTNGGGGDGLWTEIPDSQRDNVSGDPFNWSFDWTPVSDRIYDIMVEATDDADNVENSPTVTHVTYDTTPPTEPIADPGEGDYNTDQTVNLSSDDATSGLASIYYTTNGNEPNDEDGTLYEDEAIDIGSDTTLKAIAYDNAGNASGILSASYQFLPPDISGESGTTITTGGLTVSWTTDHLATSRVIFDTVSHPAIGGAPNYDYANSTIETDTAPKVTSHTVTLTGLGSATTYYYRTVSHGSPESAGPEHSFVTKALDATTTTTSDGGTTTTTDGTTTGTTAAASPSPSPAPGLVAGAQTELTGSVIIPSESPTPSPEVSPEILGATIPAGRNWRWLLLLLLFPLPLFWYWRLRRMNR